MRSTAQLDRAMQMERPILLTPNETAKTGIMSIYAIRMGIAQNTIPYVKIGKHYRINYTQLLKQMNAENT